MRQHYNRISIPKVSVFKWNMVFFGAYSNWTPEIWKLCLKYFFRKCVLYIDHKRAARTKLNVMFPNKWIIKYGEITYPPWSPDLIILYYLWRRILYKYREHTMTRKNMVKRIKEAIRLLNADRIFWTADFFQNKLNLCIL